MVANHAGGLWALDGVMTAIAVHEEHPNHRFLRMLGADLVFTTPVLGPLARKTGSTLACNPDAERLLSQRRAGRGLAGGLQGHRQAVQRALQAAAVRPRRIRVGGAAYRRADHPDLDRRVGGDPPVLGNAKTLARILDLPYFPLTPTFPWLGPLGLVPLPSKWYIEFGEPIATAEYGAHGGGRPDARLRADRPGPRDRSRARCTGC